MALRLGTTLIGLPLILISVILGAPLLVIMVVALAACALWEFYRLFLARLDISLFGFSLVWLTAILVNGQFDGVYTLPVVSFGLLATLGLILFRGYRADLTPIFVVSIIGPLYLGIPLSYALLMRSLENGSEWLLMALLTTFAVDSGAFLVGKAFGRRSLAPNISPGKTWEGAIGGGLAGVGACVILSLVLGLPLVSWEVVMIGVTIGFVSQIGDLVESSMKRAVGVKQSGRLLPGHGGVLDRLDSIVFVLVVLYYFAVWLD